MATSQDVASPGLEAVGYGSPVAGVTEQQEKGSWVVALFGVYCGKLPLKYMNLWTDPARSLMHFIPPTGHREVVPSQPSPPYQVDRRYDEGRK